MKIGFIGLGNVGGKLAGSLLRNGFDLTVRDLNEKTVRAFIKKGAKFGESPKQMVESSDLIITCLPVQRSALLLWKTRMAYLQACQQAKFGQK